MSSDNKDPKIIVDDDWKSKVQQEKEQLREQMESMATGQHGQPEMPPASMPILVTTLATQALANLGQIPDPVDDKPVVRKALAKHFIDTLAMLEEKTAGNLTTEESDLLSETLHQLRMVFVAVPDRAEPPAEDKPRSSTIELPG